MGVMSTASTQLRDGLPYSNLVFLQKLRMDEQWCWMRRGASKRNWGSFEERRDKIYKKKSRFCIAVNRYDWKQTISWVSQSSYRSLSFSFSHPLHLLFTTQSIYHYLFFTSLVSPLSLLIILYFPSDWTQSTSKVSLYHLTLHFKQKRREEQNINS